MILSAIILTAALVTWICLDLLTEQADARIRRRQEAGNRRVLRELERFPHDVH